MGKTILFRAATVTIAVIGGIIFAEKFVVLAAIVWILDAVLLFLFFPSVEGDPASRRGRLAAVVVPVLFFICASGLVFMPGGRMPPYSLLVLALSAGAQCLAVLGLLRLRIKH